MRKTFKIGRECSTGLYDNTKNFKAIDVLEVELAIPKDGVASSECVNLCSAFSDFVFMFEKL